MTSVVFKWGDGTTIVYEYPTKVRGLRHKGLRPNSLEVVDSVHDIKVVEWINQCHWALASYK